MSDTMTEILNTLREINGRLIRVESALGTRRAPIVVRGRKPRPSAASTLRSWHERVGDRTLTTREVSALGLEGMPAGTPWSIARELAMWADVPHAEQGEAAVYCLRCRVRHNQRVWSVERLS